MRGCPSLRCARESCLNSGRSGSYQLRRTHLVQRTSCFTTSAASRNAFSKGEQDVVSPRHEALTLLHKASKVVSATLDQKGLLGLPANADVWDGILSKAHEDLSNSTERAVNITVLGLNEWSGSQEFVAALLADPLSSDEEVIKALNERWKEPKQTSISITHGPLSQAESSTLTLPSACLSRFPVPVELLEMRTLSTQTTNSPSPEDTLCTSKIMEADIPIILVNPLTTPLNDIPISKLPSNTILILTSGIPQADLDAFLEDQGKSQRQTKSAPIRILAVDPKRAAQAVRLLHADPHSFTTVQRYQDDVVGSQIASVTRAIQEILAEHPSTPIRTRLALSKMQDAFNTSRTTLRLVRSELSKAFEDANRLQEKIEETSVRIHSSVFERKESAPGSQKTPENEVVVAIDQATKEMSHVMDRLTWWRMISRIDEISSTISAAVSRVWCRDLERQLILQTGKLSAIQHETTKSGLDLLSKHTIVQSAVLKNNLLQLRASPRYYLSPESLTKPIYSRRDQIIDYPTTRLHIEGQKALITMSGGLVSGVGIGWAGWLGWFLGSGEGLFGFLEMDTSTAVGVGALTAVAGIRWGVGKWEKAKKRWWQDWKRVGQGLERDLKTTLSRTMTQQVTVIGRTAANGVLEAVKRREEEIAEGKKELDGLQSSLDRIVTKIASRKDT